MSYQAIYYYRDAKRQLVTHREVIDARSLTEAKRLAKAKVGTDIFYLRLVTVECVG